MAVPPLSERQKRVEPEPSSEGIHLRFTNPELLRAFILDPEGPQPLTLAERMAGISEVHLGEFFLDGKLFRRAIFTLVVEPDSDTRGKHPTAVIRADIELGGEKSKLFVYQAGKLIKRIGSSETPLVNIATVYQQLSEERGERPSTFYPRTQNTALFFDDGSSNKGLEKAPLASLQVWDPDLGLNFVQVSLFSMGRKTGDIYIREGVYDADKEGQFEVDPDDRDRWKFYGPVGVDVHDEEQFIRAITFYEGAFASMVEAIYQAEEMELPNIAIEIEPPLIFKGQQATTFDDIGGLDSQKQFLKALAMEEKNGGQIGSESRAILFYGASGMGKTSLIEAFAAEMHVPLVRKTSLDLPQGDLSEDDMLNFFESAYLEAKSMAVRTGRKAVLAIEEIQAFLGSARIKDFVRNKLEEWREDRDVVIMATSTHPDAIEAGIMDRFVALEVSPPRKRAVKEILGIHIRKLSTSIGNPLFFAEVNLEKVADRIDHLGWSGHDIVKFLSGAHSLYKLQQQEGVVKSDTDFLLGLLPDRRLGFRTS